MRTILLGKLFALKSELDKQTKIEAERVLKNNKLLEDFLFIDNSIPEILKLSEEKLIERYKKTLEPLIQIANNSGFEFWNK